MLAKQTSLETHINFSINNNLTYTLKLLKQLPNYHIEKFIVIAKGYKVTKGEYTLNLLDIISKLRIVAIFLIFYLHKYFICSVLLCLQCISVSNSTYLTLAVT